MASHRAGQGAGAGSQVGGSIRNPPVLHRLGNAGSRGVYGRCGHPEPPLLSSGEGLSLESWAMRGCHTCMARFLATLAKVCRGPVAGRWARTWGVEEQGLPSHLTVLLPPPSAEIARHFRFGNQEDAHEFLRYTIDAMQKACLSGYAKYALPSPTFPHWGRPGLTPTPFPLRHGVRSRPADLRLHVLPGKGLLCSPRPGAVAGAQSPGEGV